MNSRIPLYLPKAGRETARKALLPIFLCALALGLSACKQQQGPPKALTPEVATVTVAQQQVLLTTELPGRTTPFRIADVRPQVNGLIQKRLFTEGSDVKEGEPLYQIDPAPFQAALDNAVAALARAEANVPAAKVRADRYKQALGERAVSQQDYDDAGAALKQAQADVDYYKAMVKTARINLGYALVSSPISGRIGVSTVTDGAIVTAYQPVALATIQQLDPIYVDVAQPATASLILQRLLKEGQIAPGGTNVNVVRLVLPDGSKYPFEGTLQFRDVSVDPTTGSVILRMVFPNPNGTLLPGMFVRALIQEGINPAAILIPQQVVSRDPKGNPYALLVNAEGKVEQRRLTLDRAIGSQWLVAAGLTPGDRVIAEGMQKVRPGSPANVVEFTGTNAPAPVQAQAGQGSPSAKAASAQPKKSN